MPLSIAIAVSGLGKIRRGSESWAMDLATALHRDGIPVALHGSARVESPVPQTPHWAMGRDSFWLRLLDYRRRYLVEQKTFAHSLIRDLRRAPPAVVHVTDPQVAWWVREALRGGNTRVFYMDGLMLGPDWNWRFDHVQVLAPYYLESARAAGRDTTGWRVIPHFIDPTPFEFDGQRAAARSRYLPKLDIRTPVVLSVGDFAPGSSKRLDHMIREIALIPAATRPHLMLVGNATPTDRQSMQGLAERLLPGGTTILTSLQRDEMPGIYRCADIFAHAALREPFGIVLPEAMASGLPVVGHRFPVTQWIVGDGGAVVDMEQEGSAAEIIGRWCRSPAERADAGRRARSRAQGHFSVRSVLPVYREAYASITGIPC